MNLIIYNSIVNGNLRPNNLKDKINYSSIAHLLNKTPKTTPEAEQALTNILGKFEDLKFNENKQKNINDYFSATDYTPVSLPTIPPEIELTFPQQNTPELRFYNFVITTEALRIKSTLIESVELIKDDICSAEEIKDTLRQFIRHAKQIVQAKEETEQTSLIFDLLLTQLIKLYFELTFIFEPLLKEKDSYSFEDFHSICLNRQPSESSSTAFNKAANIHITQKAIQKEFDKTEINQLLGSLYLSLAFYPNDSKLIAMTVALENFVFFHSENETIPEFQKLYESEIIKECIKTKRQAFNAEINVLSNPREVLAIIEEFTDSIPTLPSVAPEIEKLLDLSVIRSLSKWLSKQQEICENNLASSFSPTIQIGTNNGSTLKTKIQQTSILEQKATARKLLNFLSGHNLKNEKIMSDNDFARLVQYIENLIDTGNVPAEIKPIYTINISNEYLRYTFYLIHKKLYSTRPIRPEWINLLHAVFSQFENVTLETTRKKFSTVPLHYDSDLLTFQKEK